MSRAAGAQARPSRGGSKRAYDFWRSRHIPAFVRTFCASVDNVLKVMVLQGRALAELEDRDGWVSYAVVGPVPEKLVFLWDDSACPVGQVLPIILGANGRVKKSPIMRHT